MNTCLDEMDKICKTKLKGYEYAPSITLKHKEAILDAWNKTYQYYGKSTADALFKLFNEFYVMYEKKEL